MRKKTGIRTYRLITLFMATMLIVAAPLLNSVFQIDFIQGWYQSISIGNLWFVSPLEGIESIITSKVLSTSLLIGMSIPILIALFMGRIFCSWVCPISFISEMIDTLFKVVTRKKYRKTGIRLPKRTLWAVLTTELLLTMMAGVPIFVFLSPPGLVGREIMMLTFFRTVAFEGVIILAVILLHIISKRFFCRHLCPLGALLGILGAKRRLYINLDSSLCINCGICRLACPLDLKPEKNETITAYCWNCGECVDACSNSALTYRWNDITVRPALPDNIPDTIPEKRAKSSEQRPGPTSIKPT